MKKKNIIKGIKVILSVIVCAAGVRFLVLANWGMDPLTGFEYALSMTLHTTLGKAALLFEGLTFCLFLLINREVLNFGSFAFCFGIGPCIDAWSDILSGIEVSTGFMTSIFYMCIGSVLVIVSIAYYLPLNFGLQSIDMYSVTFAKMFHKSYGTGLTIVYCIMIIAAALLGVWPGITTIVAMTIYGRLIDMVRNKFFYKYKHDEEESK